MNIKELLEFCQTCPFCQKPMPLYTKFSRLEYEVDILDDICSFRVGGIGKLEINILKNTWRTSTINDTTHVNLNNRHFIFGRKCTCASQTCWQSSSISFDEDKTIRPVSISSLMFQRILDEEKIVITSNYKEEYTSVSKYTWSKYFSYSKSYYNQLPLIDFDFTSREKVESKLKMIMTFL
jgi:hypothetical protein